MLSINLFIKKSPMKEHKISLTSAVLLNMNILIGSGILIGPGQIAALAGSASFLAWPLVALFFLPLVLCTAQLSSMFPGCGGFYSYAKEGLNKGAGFTSGWLYVVGYIFAVAVEMLALRQTLLASSCTSWFIENALVFNVLCLVLFIGLNLMSFKLFSRILNSLTITKLLPLIILVLLLPFIINPTFTITGAEIKLLPFSLPLAMFGFFGFEYCCSLTHLIEDSERNAPRAILYGFLATAALYTLFHFGLLNLMGAENLAQYGAPAYAQFLTLPIPYLKTLLMLLIPVAAILTIFAATNGMLNANAIMLHSMASERLFAGWSKVSVVNRYGRPIVGLLIQGVVVLGIVTFMPNISLVGGLCNLGIFSAFLLPFVSLLLLQHKKGLYHRMILTVIGIVATIGFSGYSWYLLGGSVSERMLNSLPLLIAMVIGAVLYKCVAKKA